MMRVYLLVILAIYSVESKAVFQKIWQGYQASKVNQSRMLDAKLNEANFKFEENLYDWQFFITPNYTHTFRDAFFSFQSQQTRSNGLTYGLSKTSYKYGTFSFSQARINYDLSEWSADNLSRLDGDQLYETVNTLTYTYDFLDQSNDTDFELSLINFEMQSLQAKMNVEQGYFDFFSVYIQAKLQVYAVKLTKEFVAEATRRVEQIKKRVRDGLSRKVELLQARSNLLNQQEALESARSSLKQNLAIIENLIGININDSYFAKLSWNHYPFEHWKKFITESDALSVDILKKRLEHGEKTLAKVAEQSGHKLLLEARYSMNDIDSDAQKSFNNATSGEHFDRSLSLTWTIPLGSSKREGLTNKTSYQLKKNELDLLTAEDEVKVRKSALLEQISYLEKAGKIAQSKIEIGKETLKEQNRLYLRGQSSFEEVIRAEEAYINARLSEKRLLAEYEMLVANFAFLNNSTKPLLDGYLD